MSPRRPTTRIELPVLVPAWAQRGAWLPWRRRLTGFGSLVGRCLFGLLACMVLAPLAAHRVASWVASRVEDLPPPSSDPSAQYLTSLVVQNVEPWMLTMGLSVLYVAMYVATAILLFRMAIFTVMVLTGTPLTEPIPPQDRPRAVGTGAGVTPAPHTDRS